MCNGILLSQELCTCDGIYFGVCCKGMLHFAPKGDAPKSVHDAIAQDPQLQTHNRLALSHSHSVLITSLF